MTGSDWPSITGKRALVTGGSAGMGAVVAASLARRGASVTIVGRNEATAQRAADQITRDATDRPVNVIAADLSLMTDVAKLAESYLAGNDSLDILVHSAGGMHPKRTLSAEGVELTWASQYLARQYLDELLVGSMLGRGARIVHISGGGGAKKALDRGNLQGERKYTGLGAIETISIANDLLGVELAARYEADGVRSYVYGPGPVRGTGLTAQMPAPLRIGFAAASHFIGSTVESAAADVVNLATGDLPSGLYQRKLKRVEPTPYVASDQERGAAWDAAEREISQCLA